MNNWAFASLVQYQLHFPQPDPTNFVLDWWLHTQVIPTNSYTMAPFTSGIAGDIAAAKEGCQTSLGKLLETYRRQLLFAATMDMHPRFRRKVAPSDLVQITFQRAHENIVGFKGSSEGELLSWLRTIMANQLAKELRGLKTLRRDADREKPLHDFTRDSSLHVIALQSHRDPSPSNHAIRKENVQGLRAAVMNLSRDQREVIELRHIEGLAFSQIASKMERTVDSVKSLWRRAILKLKTTADNGLI